MPREYGIIVLKTNEVTAAHIPGTINIEAEKQSRALEDATEWKLNPALYYKIWKTRQDLFTTRINKQLDRYVSWHPETRTNGY